jgi:hypothetical protein
MDENNRMRLTVACREEQWYEDHGGGQRSSRPRHRPSTSSDILVSHRPQALSYIITGIYSANVGYFHHAIVSLHIKKKHPWPETPR